MKHRLWQKNLGLDAFKRYLTLKTDRIYSLPIAILMPNSGCNCRCVMCDIWKTSSDNRQLSEEDVQSLLASLKKLNTQWVVMSGGEALMNPNLFRLCRILRSEGMRVTLLSTGLLLKPYAEAVLGDSDEVIVSLDGSPEVHNAIRRIPKAYQKLEAGVQYLKSLDPEYPINARCVIQQQNFQDWPNIIQTARGLGLDSISFLPADTTSEAFNRPEQWDEARSDEVRILPDALPQLQAVIDQVLEQYQTEIDQGFIVESAEKLQKIHSYYAALAGLAPFPQVRCNAPWVSAVVEADGQFRPCFFHPSFGSIHQKPLIELLNSPESIAFRQGLDMDQDPLCKRCVCSLNLRPTSKLF